MIVRKLDEKEYKGRKYKSEILSDRYLSIEPGEEGFDVRWVMSEEPLRMTVSDEILADWLEDPAAYGAFEEDRLAGFVEGFLEKWNNRYKISNICVFDHDDRRSGTGTMLMDAILKEAAGTGARMAVLETQTFNYPAVSFYQKHGFQIIGFDRYAYSTRGTEEHNMLITMGITL